MKVSFHNNEPFRPAEASCKPYHYWVRISSSLLLLVNILIDLCSLPSNNGRFARFPPHVAAQCPRCLDDAMARNQVSNRIVANSRPDRPCCCCLSNLLSDCTVGTKPSQWDFQEAFPYFQLKIAAFQMELYLLQGLLLGFKDGQGVSLIFIGSGHKLCLGKSLCQLIEHGRFVISKSHIAQSSVCTAYYHLSKGALLKAVVNFNALACIFVLRRCHPFNLHKQVVQPTGA